MAMGRSVELVAEESPDAIQAQAFDAAKTGDLNALQDALANGAELEARNAPYRDTVLNIAITHGNTDLAVWLLEQGADANTGGGGRIALHNAIFRDNLAVTKLLIAHGADVEARDRHGNTPLMSASRTTPIEIFTFLLEQGAVVQVQNKKGATPLHYATQTWDEDKAQRLLDRGADPTIADAEGNTPLHIVAKMNLGVRIAELLIQHGADRTQENHEGFTPYEVLSARDHPQQDTVALLKP